MTMVELMNKGKEMYSRIWGKNAPTIAEQEALTGVCV